MKLPEITSFLKSANAGASELTFDIGFATRETFDKVVTAGAITPETIGRLYSIDPSSVRVFAYEPALIIKVTIPRVVRSGGIAERDFDGTQQYAPLLDLEIAL
jgi:hypothetical protein